MGSAAISRRISKPAFRWPPAPRKRSAGFGSLWWRWLLALACFAPLARAHNIFSSWTDAHIHSDRIKLEFTLSRISALRLIVDGEKLPPISPENFGEYAPKLKAIAHDLFELGVGGQVIPLSTAEVTISGEDDVAFHLTFPRPPEGTLRIFGNYLQFLVDGHVGTLVATQQPASGEGITLGWSPLSIDQPSCEFKLPIADAAPSTTPPAPSSPPFGTFLRLGVHHILIGYDHLLFLLGLIVACHRFRTMAGIITCFTLAHSITLALAAFDVVTLSPRIVEPLIAASIVFVGAENLILRGAEPKRRGLLTFVFGLIHGFGFAGALKEVGHGLVGRALAMPLFSFNLGVELGQIAVAAACLPILIALRRWGKFDRYGAPAISALVAIAGLSWLLQRTVLS